MAKLEKDDVIQPGEQYRVIDLSGIANIEYARRPAGRTDEPNHLVLGDIVTAHAGDRSWLSYKTATGVYSLYKWRFEPVASATAFDDVVALMAEL